MNADTATKSVISEMTDTVTEIIAKAVTEDMEEMTRKGSPKVHLVEVIKEVTLIDVVTEISSESETEEVPESVTDVNAEVTELVTAVD